MLPNVGELYQLVLYPENAYHAKRQAMLWANFVNNFLTI